MNAASLGRLSATYPAARVRGRLVTRSDGRTLGWASLNAATAEEIGREHVGWFVGGHPGVAQVAEQLGRLDANPEGGVWVVAPQSRELARELFALWPHPDHVVEPPRAGGAVWRGRKVWVAIPEDLRRLLSLARAAEPGVAGVIVVDPPCVLYRSRGGPDPWGRVHTNDRPQHVVNFRAALAADGWQPPLLLLTCRPALAIDPQVVARAFCLHGFRFIAGDSFACWDVPVDSD